MKSSLTITATCALAAAAAASWQSRSPMPEGVAGGAAGELNGSLIYAGGTTWRGGEKIWLSTVHRYDLARDQWTNAAELPEALAYGASVSTEGAVEIMGGVNGKGPSLNCWRLQAGSEKWERTGSLPHASALSRAATIDGRVFLFGGCPDVADLTGCTDAVMMRDEQGLWSSAGKNPGGPVALAASAVAKNNVFLFGGCVPKGPGMITNVDSAWRYDAARHMWHALRPLPAPTRSLSAVALDDNRILVAGGYRASQAEAKLHGPEYGFSDAVWVYHIDRDEYASIERLPHPVAGLEFVFALRKLFALGGEDKARSRSAALLEFLPARSLL